MQYGARQLGCTKVQVHSYPDEPSHGARCSSAPVVTRIGVVLARRHRAPRRPPVEISFHQALDELEHAVAAFAALVHLRHGL